MSNQEFSTVADHLAASLEIIERNLNYISHSRDSTLSERLQTLRTKIHDAQAWLNYLYR